MTPAALDPNALFRAAEAHFAGGDAAAALPLLDRITRQFGAHAPVLHLTALAHRRLSQPGPARAAFEAALRLAPADVQIRNNYANLLADLGDLAGALAQLDKVAAARPSFADAAINRALVLQRLGRADEALAALDRLAPEAMGARAQTLRGGLLHETGRVEQAAHAFDRALAIEPNRATALAGRARAALERGEAGAVDRYRRALAARPDDLELRLGLALAMEADGEGAAIGVLEEICRQHPDRVEAHEQLARMQSEAGQADRIAWSFDRAIAVRPADLALHLAHWRTLVRAQRFDAVLAAMADAPPAVTGAPQAALMRAICTGETGDTAAAERLFAALPDGAEVRLARGRHALRAGRADEAGRLLERVVADDPDDITGWAHLTLAWRLTGDPRIAWLCERPELWGTIDLPLSDGDLADLATLLRSLHRTRAHPIGQSLRGGTQTRGRLLIRPEPLLVQLRGVLERAVAAHVAALPPADPTHPLLRHRDRHVALAGSWSVRLTGNGFHVSHIHPLGVLSSAMYVALPPEVTGSATRDGWLELGAPPRELGLDLPPLAVVEPRPGRLALFPSYFFHATRPFASGERLTVAFDVTATG